MRRLLPSPAALAVAALGFLVTFTVKVKADDVWWHLAAGERMLATGTLPSTNLWSFTAPDAPWVAHEWLSEVLFALLHRVHPSVLALAATALQVSAFALVALLARGSGGTPGASAFLALVASVLLLANFSIRPYLLGNLALLATLLLAEHPAWRPRARLLAVVALFAAWANLHGSFVFGLGVLGLWALTARERRAWRWLDLLLATLACLATPHPLEGLLLPLRYLRTSLTGSEPFLGSIMEWQRVDPLSPLGLVLGACLLAALALVGASRLRPRLEHVGLLLVFALGAFAAVRNAALLGIALAVVLPRHLLALRRGPAPEVGQGVALPMLAWAAAALTTLGDPLPTDFFPRAALAQLTPADRVLNSFNWGGALAFAGLPVFIDQRNDCYPPAVLADYLEVHRLAPGWREVLARWQVDAVLWPAGGRLAEALAAEPGWRLAWEDEQAVVFRRAR